MGSNVLAALSEVVPVDSFSPVIVLTADISEEAKRNALNAGAKDFIAKPFDPVEVMLRVRNLLETRALYQAMQRQNAALAAEIRQRSERERRTARERNQRVRRIRAAMATSAVEMVFQPVVDVLTARLVGVEALARFPGRPARPPDQWFVDAGEVGLGAELELLAVRAAISQAPRLPADSFLAVNVSPSTVLHSGLIPAVRGCEVPVVIELTEHAPVDEYRPVIEALGELRSFGVRVAVDDAGSGYASLQHILRLLPDIIKLDLDLTRGVDVDPARRALAASLVVFGNEIGARIIAEGVETADELDALRHLGVRWAQGYHLARPGPLPVPRLVDVVDVSDPTLFDVSDDPSSLTSRSRH